MNRPRNQPTRKPLPSRDRPNLEDVGDFKAEETAPTIEEGGATILGLVAIEPIFTQSIIATDSSVEARLVCLRGGRRVTCGLILEIKIAEGGKVVSAHIVTAYQEIEEGGQNAKTDYPMSQLGQLQTAMTPLGLRLLAEGVAAFLANFRQL